MICRLCLQEANCPIEIFDTNGEQLNIVNIIEKHFWFKPLPNDNISTKLCRKCWCIINDFHQYYVLVAKAHEIFEKTDKGCTIIKGEMDVDPTMATVHFDVEVDIKEEDTAWNYEFDDNPLYEPEVPSSVVAEVEQTSINNESNKTVIDHLNEETNKSKDLSETEIKNTVVSKPRKCKQKTVSMKTIQNKPQNVSKQKRSTMITSKDDEIIKKHIPMGCNLCTFVGENFSDMTKHFRAEHGNQSPYVMCCGRKLNKRFLVVHHAYKHEDPEFFKCKECHKVFSDGYVLRSHQLAAHAPETELTYECDQCPKRFSRRYLLELHKPSHIPINERQFICEKCPHVNAFASDHLLQIHVNMRHNKATNVCHVCAKEIRDNQAFEKHVRLHFEDSGPRVKCPRPDCDRWLKDLDNLKQHLRRHNIEGKVYTCNDCGKVCKNRSALTSHFNYAHSNAVFSCEECNKTFKKAISLKEHMAQHTGESLYKCPFCTRTFNSNANMHSHKKKMHPVEWDVWRKTKRGHSQHEVSNQIVLKAVATTTKGN
ncbi:transcription factor grauzone isoform X2 [Teleopsis dalmanni]|uniref:transcription factor grauzone isoform X2 n=1 Tax=Teleopsis dalmanni TaxID=139649 RepID=UPI0018CECDE9|nr:transcription factor grauzone isoform X2 [Teleopsis dalmanni]